MDELTWDELAGSLTTTPLFVVASDYDLDVFFYGKPLAYERLYSRIIRGERCGSIETLHQEWAAALQFRWYYGENWNAFDDFILVLDWIDADAFAFFITNVQRITPDGDAQFGRLMHALREASERWTDPAKVTVLKERKAYPFNVVLHCPPAAAADAEDRLAALGIEVGRRHLNS